LSRHGLSIMPRTDNTRLISGHFEQMKHLSPQQTLILRELGHGLGNDAIARRLDLSLSMTKAQVKRIVEQLGLRNRTDAALFGASLLTIDSSQHTSFG
jgi:DNA-binding NarL/FixJ family response regulator